MLYDRWIQTARSAAAEMALAELSSGRRWTFAELQRAGERWPAPPGPWACPRGNGAAFIFDLLAGWRENKIVCPLEADQLAPKLPPPPAGCVHLKTTSATAGPPQFIAFRAEQLLADVRNICATMGLRRDWANLGVVSMAHSYGFSSLALPLLIEGVPLILVDSPLPERLRQAAALHPALILPAAPALWRAWREADAIPKNVRLAISAGAPLPLALERDLFGKRGVKLHNFYGASECGGIAYDSSEQPRTEPDVGAPLKNVAAAVVAGGCLEVRGQAVGQTYWPEPLEALSHGCFSSSDLARIERGKIFLEGRVSDLINVAGRKVSPDAVERVLSECPAVQDCLVFGISAGECGETERVAAAVELQADASLEQVKCFAQRRLAPWQMPRHWQVVPALPANARGKRSRADARRQFRAEGSQRWNLKLEIES